MVRSVPAVSPPGNRHNSGVPRTEPIGSSARPPQKEWAGMKAILGFCALNVMLAQPPQLTLQQVRRVGAGRWIARDANGRPQG
jgi:hypothetical protein